MATKPTTTKRVAVKVPKKPRAGKKKEEATVESVHEEQKAVQIETSAHATKPSSKYVFATGRRKTAVANVRLFEGSGKHMVNKKPFESYFQYAHFQDKALKPFNLSGLEKKYHFIAHISGGGSHSQAEALSHGLARALAAGSEEVKGLLKKNGLLTRDDRKKERKKPGLKRARRAPQWAKR
ncbi:MAG: 30S ribosomal protein S9 [Candidatus Doudnabacteria bacterium]|nr:30S ribosomal protein S9 [Candidatus Doudnabacteria bacterium]